MDQIALPLDPDQETRLHNSFARQPIMLLLNARIVKASLGEVQIEFPFNSSFTQQNGYMHAGILTTVVDTACGAPRGAIKQYLKGEVFRKVSSMPQYC